MKNRVLVKGFISNRRADVLCLVAILALATLFLFPALRPGRTLLPLALEGGIAPWHKQVSAPNTNLLLSDPFYTFYPRRHFFTAALQRGIYPLWNPYIFSGHPVAGDTAAQTFYPPNILAAVFLPAARALPMLAWFHLAFTGIAMFALLRLLALAPAPALFGAVAWMLNGDSVVWLENPHRLSTLAWMPAVFLFYELALRRRRAWPGVVAGLFYGLVVLGGHTQFALVLAILLVGYALYHAALLLRTQPRAVWHPFAVLVLVGLVGAGIGAVQLLPSFELARLSHRGISTMDQFLAMCWPLAHAVGLWVPDFFGNPVRFPYWGQANFAEVTAYYGALAFPLTLTGLLWVRKPHGRFFACAFLVVALIAWGTPLVWLIAWIPGFRFFRLLSLTVFLSFLGAAAAAFALDAALARAGNRDRRPQIVLVLVLAGLVAATAVVLQHNAAQVAPRWSDIRPHLWRTGLIWVLGLALLVLARRRTALAAGLIVLLLAADLVQWGMPFNPVHSLDILYPENEVSAWLRQDPSLYRVLPLQTDRVVFGPNVLSVLGFSETGGYSSLMVGRYRDLVKRIDDQVAVWWMRPNQNMLVNSRFSPLFSLLNVKYVLASHPLDQPLFSVDASYPGCAGPGVLLKEGLRFTQPFRARYPGLNRVDIEFMRLGSAQGQSLRFLLWRDREGGELVADITVDAHDLPDQGPQVFFFAPISDSSGQDFVWAVEASGAGAEPAVAICQAEGEPAGWPAFAAYSTQLAQVDIRQGVWLYENPNVLPRAYVVHRAEVVPESLLLGRLADPGFNPWSTVLLEMPLPPEQAAQMAQAPLRSGSTVQVTRYDLHAVEMAAEMRAPGILILSDAWYPGWEVTVDGAPATLLRANYALRGVYLAEGKHQVSFRFRPLSVYLGLAITGLTLTAAMAVLGWDLRRSFVQVAHLSMRRSIRPLTDRPFRG